MTKIYEINDFTLDSFVHGTIEKFYYDWNGKIFEVIFSYLNLKQGGCIYGCTITITDWWSIETSLTKSNKEVDINELSELIAKNPIDSAIYEYLIDEGTVTLNGHVSDYLFSLKFVKPKIHITGEYDPE